VGGASAPRVSEKRVHAGVEWSRGGDAPPTEREALARGARRPAYSPRGVSAAGRTTYNPGPAPAPERFLDLPVMALI